MAIGTANGLSRLATAMDNSRRNKSSRVASVISLMTQSVEQIPRGRIRRKSLSQPKQSHSSARATVFPGFACAHSTVPVP